MPNIPPELITSPPEETTHPGNKDTSATVSLRQEELLAAVQKLGLKESDLGNVDNLNVPPQYKSLLKRVAHFLFGPSPERQRRSTPAFHESRRQFLINGGRAIGAVTTGLLLGELGLDSLASDGEQNRTESDNNAEVEQRIVALQETKIENESLRSLVFADKICFYEDAAFTNEDAGLVPRSNKEFFHNRQAELLGFVEKPSFLVLHTDGGRDVRSTIQSLNERNIQCQFMVGMLEQKPVSIQAAPLQADKVNITGTVSGGELNDYEANLQFWGSLNIEIEGTPDSVNEELIPKTVELCMQIMPSYGLKISQLVGHMEVPNNGKPDPGRAILREIRTQVYLELLKKGLYDLLDISPNQDKNDLQKFFTVSPNLPAGPAAFNNENRAKCWMPTSEDFVDWQRISSFMSHSPAILTDFQKYPEGKIQIETVKENVAREWEEVYMGFPPGFAEWLRLPNKPLGSPEFTIYRPNATSKFILEVITALQPNQELSGATLPLSYSQIQNLARLFISTRPYENRGQKLADAMVSLTEGLGQLDQSWQEIKNAYEATFDKIRATNDTP